MTRQQQYGLSGPFQGIYMITTPMPFPLKSSNGFIAETDQGWIIIDGGVNTETNQQIWNNALREIGISWRQLSEVYLTHYHHDHLGLAGWMQQQSDAPVYLDGRDARMIEYLQLPAEGYVRQYCNECNSHTWSNELQMALAEDIVGIAPLITPLPCITMLPPCHTFSLAGYRMSFHSIPGHTDGHVTFVGDNRLVFLGDNLLAHYQLHATDWPHNWLSNPLQHFLTGMSELAKLPVNIVLPGHGPIFENFSERLHLLYQHHYQRAGKVWEQLIEPMTAWQLAQRVFPNADYIHIKRLILAETLAYLQLLEYQGLVRAEHTTGITQYQRTSGTAFNFTMEQLFWGNID